MTEHAERCKRRRFGLLSPAGWLIRAVVLLVLFAAMHLLGWREHTNVFSGTLGLNSTADYLRAIAGGLYVIAWFATVVVAPILLIAAGVFALLLWRRSPTDPATDDSH